jgi:GDP-L-fucose synthase
LAIGPWLKGFYPMTYFPKIYVAGHRGMVGSAIVRQLLAQGQPAERIVSRTHA